MAQDFQEILSSQQYLGLTEVERAKVAEKLLPQMSEFSGLDDGEKSKFLTHVVQQGLPAKSQVQEKPAQQTPTPKPEQKSTLERGAEYVKGFFEPQTPKTLSSSEIKGEVAGGGIGGALTGIAGPKILEGAGALIRRIPTTPTRVIGTGMELAGEAWGRVPASVRAVKGAGGGAAMGGASAVAESTGASKATTLGIEVGGSMLGEGTGSLAMKGAQALKVAALAVRGSASGATFALKDMLETNKPLNEATAKKLQEQVFGKKFENDLPHMIPATEQAKVYEKLHAADPTLIPGKPASAQLRDRYFEGVTDLIRKSQQVGGQNLTFPSSPEFRALQEKFKTMEALNQLSPQEIASINKSLGAPVGGKNPFKVQGVADKYAENVDDLIRTWAKGSEKGQAYGAAAIPQKNDLAVRAEVRQAWNGYLERNGKGRAEESYRGAYSQEKIAESKDNIGFILGDYKGSLSNDKVQKLTRSMLKDTTVKPLVLQGIRNRLAETPVQTIDKEFDRLDNLLIQSKILDLSNPSDVSTLQYLRAQSKAIKAEADQGQKVALGQKMQRLLVGLSGRSLASAAGQAYGARQDSQQ